MGAALRRMYVHVSRLQSAPLPQPLIQGDARGEAAVFAGQRIVEFEFAGHQFQRIERFLHIIVRPDIQS